MDTLTISKPLDQAQKDEDPPGGSHHNDDYSAVSQFIDRASFLAVTAKYPFTTTPYYLSLAQKNLNDPIMRQLCPSAQELEEQENFSDDPLAEEESSPVPGLVHRYPDRVLMIVTNICFMNCRHCTRKRLWEKGRAAASADEIQKMIDYVSQHTEIRDVILSGGDPLTFSDEALDAILSKIRNIPHVEIIRLGTRAPVVNPQRITRSLALVLKKYRPLWLNTQFNHAREITEASAAAINTILEAGIPVNNQSVLLKGINDDVDAMRQLCHGLLKIGVRPYYLFHCDPVAGTSHFRTSVSKGIEIIEGLRGHTSGLAVPNYVVDAIDGGGKIPLQPQYLVKAEDGRLLLRNYQGRFFAYQDNPL